jgi:hypothetical protein
MQTTLLDYEGKKTHSMRLMQSIVLLHYYELKATKTESKCIMIHDN